MKDRHCEERVVTLLDSTAYVHTINSLRYAHIVELAIAIVRPMIEFVTMITQDESDTVFFSAAFVVLVINPLC
jgi:hypothetical protein